MRSTSSGRQPEWPRASVFARSRSIARTTSRGNGGPTPAACDAIRFSWSRAASAGRDERGREVAEAGRDAVDDLARRDEPLDDVARLLHPLAGMDVEGGAGAVARDRLDVGDGQVGAGQHDEVARAADGGSLRDEVGVGHRCEDSRLSSAACPRPQAAPDAYAPRRTRELPRPCSHSSTRSSSRS